MTRVTRKPGLPPKVFPPRKDSAPCGSEQVIVPARWNTAAGGLAYVRGWYTHARGTAITIDDYRGRGARWLRAAFEAGWRARQASGRPPHHPRRDSHGTNRIKAIKP